MTSHTKQVCLALPCMWRCMLYGLAASSYIGYPSLAFSEIQEFAQSTWEGVDLWTLLHRLTCVQWADWDPKGQFYIPAVSGRNSSFFSLLPLSFLLPVHPLGRMEAPIIDMSEAAGEDAGYCSMSKTSQVSEFVFKQQDPAKSEYRFSLSLRWSGEPSTLL